MALLETVGPDEKAEVIEIAYSLLILHLPNSVLRKVDNANTVAKIWLKLEICI